MRRRILVNLGVFTLVAVFFTYWALTNIVRLDFIERPFKVTGDFENAMGVLPNAEVTYLGTQVGLVETVERTPGGVRVTMALTRGKEIPRDASAHIWRKSALGEQYIDFMNPPDHHDGDPILKEGDHIPRERTDIPIEFAELLRAADGLLASIDPEDLRTVTHELAVGLLGRTDDLRSLIVEGDRLATTFADRTEALDRLATNNTRLTRVLADHSGSLVASLEDLRAVTESLNGVADDIAPLVDSGTDAFARLAPVIHNQKDSLACLFDALDDVLDISTTDARLAGLARFLRDGPTAVAGLVASTDIQTDSQGAVHQWVRVDLTSDAQNPAVDYVPERPTPPAVPAAAACAVQFASADPGEADAAPPPDTGVTPATGAALEIVSILGALALLAAIRILAPGIPE